MAFIVENISGAQLDLDDIGLSLITGATLDLTTESSSEIIAASAATGGDLNLAVAAGSLIVKDPIDGVTNLSIAEGIIALASMNDPHWRLGSGARVNDISDVTITSATDGEVLSYSGGTWVNSPNSGFSGLGIWRYRTAVTANPTAGQLQFNNATIESATSLYVNVINDGGTDMSAFLALITSGSLIYLQLQDDSTQFIVVEVGTSSLLSGVYTFPITTVESQGTAPSNNSQVAFVVAGSGSGGGGGDPDQNLWETITSDSGSAVANTTTDTLTITGGPGINTSITGDVLTIGSGASQAFTDMHEPTGFINRTDSEISFDVGTRTFSIDVLAPASDYSYYIHGVEYTISITKTAIIPDTTGLYYFYLDNAEVLQFLTAFDEVVLLADNAYVANVYWNDTPAAGTDDLVVFADERHGITMDGETHLHLHQSFGTRYINGLGITNIVTDPSTPIDTDVQFTVADGEIRDEDLRHDIIDDGAVPGNVFDLIQDLQPTAQVPVWFRTGASGVWNKAPATSFPFIYSDGVVFTGGVNGLMPWNEDTGATWQLTESSNNSFTLMHYFATNDILNPVVAIQGITNYNNKPSGRDQALVEINQLSGLPFAEFTPIATVIIENRSSYTNTPQARFRTTDDGFDYVDWRDTDLYGGSSSGTTQNLWESIVSDVGIAVANSPNDALTLAGGTGISTAVAGDTVIITNDAPNVDQALWETITADSGSATANIATDTFTITGGTAIGTAIVGDAVTITYNGAISDNSDVDTSGVVDGQHLVYNGGAGEWQPVTPTSSGVLGFGDWNFETTLTAPPSNQSFRFNNADPTLATALYVDNDNLASVDMSLFLSGVSEGSYFFGQKEDDASVGYISEVTAVTQQTGYVEYTISTNTVVFGGPLVNGDDFTLFAANSADQNVWETMAADSGSATATSPTDTFTIAGGTGITTAITGSTVTINASGGGGGDELVKVSANDTTAGFLNGKLVVTTNETTLTEVNDGANETLEVGISDDVILPGTGAATVPSGTDGQQPAGVNGMIRYNTTDNRLEAFVNGLWRPLAVEGPGSFAGSPFALHFIANKVQGDTWMGTTSVHIDSNKTHYIMPYPSELVAIAYQNSEADTSPPIAVEVASFGGGSTNSTLVTYTPTQCRVAYRSDFSGLLLSAGDKVAVMIGLGADSEPDDVVVSLYLRILLETSEASQEEDYAGDFT